MRRSKPQMLEQPPAIPEQLSVALESVSSIIESNRMARGKAKRIREITITLLAPILDQT